MAGIKIQKNYVSSSINNATLANNWMVLVYGVTDRGTTKPTLVQSYRTFIEQFGQPVSGVPTHAYMRFLLENGVPVLFKRVIKSKDLVAASATIQNSSSTDLFSVMANDAYLGNIGNDLAISITKNTTTNACVLQIKLGKDVVETFSLGQDVNSDMGNLVYAFISQAARSTTNISNYVSFKLISDTESDWMNTFPIADKKLENGSEPANDKASALGMLSDSKSELYDDVRLIHAMTYYPQLRFVTTGGICDSDTDKQEVILENLGKFATNCDSSFRVLVDYSVEMTDINTVRNFVRNTAAKNVVSTSIFAFFGFYGADSNNNYLPGSAGFLTALARSGYNVYSRRIAGTGFSPAFTKPYKEVYVDALADWQAEDVIQLNPIMVVDAQDNLAVMGSSTLAMPLSALNSRNPAQALDVVCVSDYVAAILHNIALGELEAALDRLSLSSLSNRMSQEVERFVSSGAITRYDLNFDTTQLGKLGVECVLYFAIGLEEVSITVTSTYDTDLVS